MLESFFRWCESSLVGRAVAESVWAFPIIEALHLIGLCMLGGALLVVDLRLLGAGMTSQPVAKLARHARPWLIGGLATMVATGVPLFLSEAIKAYYNTSFWVKMATLPVALAFTFTVRERVTRGASGEGEGEARPVRSGVEAGAEPEAGGRMEGGGVDAEAVAGRMVRLREGLVGAISLALWFVVAAAGRWIGYS